MRDDEIPENWRDVFLTVDTAARVVSLTRHALYNRIHRGEGPELARIGRSVRIKGSELEKWVTRSSSKTEADLLPSRRTRWC